MIKLRRPKLPEPAPRPAGKRGPKPKGLQEDLDDRKAKVLKALAEPGVDAGKTIDEHWGRFKSSDNKRNPSIKALLGDMTHGKCAYCEALEATDVEHHWPKIPTLDNEHRGSPERMFQWENLLLACGKCNDPQHKGQKMEWVGKGKTERTKLLDPSAEGDDPFCSFTVDRHGWVDPRKELSEPHRTRAAYTIETLRLNLRDAVRGARAEKLEHLYQLLRILGDRGPDFVLETGTTIRQSFVEFVSPKRPYLAPIRQVLRENPELRAALLQQIPELGPQLEAWDLEPDCARTTP
jgi:uncharacterized protein (TIGR02646 family)